MQYVEHNGYPVQPQNLDLRYQPVAPPRASYAGGGEARRFLHNGVYVDACRAGETPTGTGTDGLECN